jgi:hypothetical protein
MLDPYSFAVIAKKRPEVGAELMRQIQYQEFSAIILLRDPGQADTKEWYDDYFFGAPFRQKVLESYHISDNTKPGNVVYIPKKDDKVRG